MKWRRKRLGDDRQKVLTYLDPKERKWVEHAAQAAGLSMSAWCAQQINAAVAAFKASKKKA